MIYVFVIYRFAFDSTICVAVRDAVRNRNFLICSPHKLYVGLVWRSLAMLDRILLHLFTCLSLYVSLIQL